MDIANILLKISGDPDGAQRALRKVAADLAGIAKTNAKATVEVATAEVQAELAALDKRLDALDGRDVTVNVRIDEDQLSALTGALGGLGGGGGGGSPVGGLAGLGGLGSTVTTLLASLPILIPLVVIFGAGLVALASSALLAAGGVGVLGVAAGAVLAPLVAIGILAVKQFTDAKDAAADLETATDALKTATEQQAAAEQQLSEAHRNADRAIKDLVGARQDARAQLQDELQAAIVAVTTAEQNLADRQVAVKVAQEALNDAREEAVRQLQDMRAAEEQADITRERAKLSLKDAKERLDDLRREGASNEEIRKAKLDVAQAELDLETARRNGQRTQEDLNEAERDGVSHSAQVLSAKAQLADAQQAVADATLQLADAQREQTRVQARSVRTEDSVIAARRQVQQATHAVHEAQRAEAKSTREVAQARRDVASANEAVAASSSRGLTRFQNSLSRIAGAFKSSVSGVFDGLARGLDHIAEAAPKINRALKPLGKAVGDTFERWAKALSSPGWTNFFDKVAKSGARIIPTFSDAMLNLATAFRRLAKHALPFLEDAVDGFKDWTRSIRDSSKDGEGLDRWINKAVENLKSWIRLIGSIAEAIGALVGGADRQGKSLVETLTKGLDAWAEWASSTEGQREIREFFRDSIPAFEEMIKLVIRLGRVFIRWSKILAPAIDGALEQIGKLLDPFEKLFDFVDGLPQPVKDFLNKINDFARMVATGGPIRLLIDGLGEVLAVLKDIWNVAGDVKDALNDLPIVGGGATRARDWSVDTSALEAVGQAGSKTGRGFGSGLAAGIMQALRHKDWVGEVFTRRDRERLRDDGAHGGRDTGESLIAATREAIRRGQAAVRRAVDIATAAAAKGVNLEQFERAGEAISKAMARGIRRAGRVAGDALKAVGESLRNLLPGSEPKDPSSPLRNLADAGRATVDNYIDGLRARGRDVGLEWASIIDSAVRVGSPQLRMLEPATVAPGDFPGRGDRIVHNNYISTPSGGSPDPAALGSALARVSRRRGRRR